MDLLLDLVVGLLDGLGLCRCRPCRGERAALGQEVAVSAAQAGPGQALCSDRHAAARGQRSFEVFGRRTQLHHFGDRVFVLRLEIGVQVFGLIEHRHLVQAQTLGQLLELGRRSLGQRQILRDVGQLFHVLHGLPGVAQLARHALEDDLLSSAKRTTNNAATHHPSHGSVECLQQSGVCPAEICAFDACLLQEVLRALLEELFDGACACLTTDAAQVTLRYPV